jgi:hypothetical protein
VLKRLLCAISFALEGDPRDYDTDVGILTFDMNVAPTRQRCTWPTPSSPPGGTSTCHAAWPDPELRGDGQSLHFHATGPPDCPAPASG